MQRADRGGGDRQRGAAVQAAPSGPGQEDRGAARRHPRRDAAGLAVLAARWHIGPWSGQTVLSQIIATVIGRGWAYYAMSLTITVVLALAANTSFGGLPVLASLLARGNYLPHLFALRDDRQVFASGIWALAVMSGALLVAVGGDTLRLIPLYAIGVFTRFIDYGVIMPRAHALYAHAASELNEPQLLEMIRDGWPVYAWPYEQRQVWITRRAPLAIRTLTKLTANTGIDQSARPHRGQDDGR